MSRHPKAEADPARGFRDEDIPFGPALAPLADAAAARLARALRGAGGMRIRPRAEAELRFQLLETMAGVSGLAFAAELQEFGGSLAEFERRVVGDGTERIRAAYPGLSAHLRTVADQWIEHSTRLSVHAARDLSTSTVRAEPQAGSSGTPEITRIRAGLSDRHRNGRTVTELGLSDGRRVAYKPRSIGPELLLGRVLAWLGTREPKLILSAPETLDCGSRGYMEWIEPVEVSDADELEAFFYRAGGLLLAIYLLSGVDCHAGNVIAWGGHPVLVDAETLGHPATEARTGEAGEGVLDTGLLPYWKRIGETWIGTGGLAYRRAPLPGPPNLPRLAGRSVRAYEFADHIVEGFLAAGRVALQHRVDLLDARGPLHDMEETRVRFLARPTQLYADLLTSSVQAGALRDPAAHWETIESRVASAPPPPSMRSAGLLPDLVRLELRALRRLDVPRFEMRLDSTTLESAESETSAGATRTPSRIDGFLALTGAERIRRRIRALTHRRLDEQVGLIRAALALDRLAAATSANGPTADSSPRDRPFNLSSPDR